MKQLLVGLIIGMLVALAGTALAQGLAEDLTCSAWMTNTEAWRIGYTFGALSVLDASPLPTVRQSDAQTVGQMRGLAEGYCRSSPSMNVARLMLWVTGYAASPPSP